MPSNESFDEPFREPIPGSSTGASDGPNSRLIDEALDKSSSPPAEPDARESDESKQRGAIEPPVSNQFATDACEDQPREPDQVADEPTSSDRRTAARRGFDRRAGSDRRAVPRETPDRRLADRRIIDRRAGAPGEPPLPKRPKGRWFVGTSLALLILFSSYAIWNGVLRYPVRGVIAGRTIEVTPPWDGFVGAIHVRPGDRVERGDILMTLHANELEQRLASLDNEIAVAQAELDAQVTRLKWESQQRHDAAQQATSEHLRTWGELLAEQSEWEIAAADVERLRAIRNEHQDAVSDKQLHAAERIEEGRRARIEKLRGAVDELRRRVDVYGQVDEDAATQFQPQMLRLSSLQAERQRVREQIDLGHVRAPVSGVVAKLLRDTGERADDERPLLEIIENGSVEAILYVPQDRIAQLELGQVVHVRIEPYEQTVACRVVRRDVRMEAPPESLERFYHEHERLLPVYAKPDSRTVDAWSLSLGSEVRLPRSWWPTAAPHNDATRSVAHQQDGDERATDETRTHGETDAENRGVNSFP